MQTLIQDLRSIGLSFKDIGLGVGMSKGAVHDLLSGRQKSVSYQLGLAITKFHRAQMRRAKAKMAKCQEIS